MQVEHLVIHPGVSLTILGDTAGWRFASWSTSEGRLPLPPAGDCARWFATAGEAAAHFRSLCTRQE
jgi:hypothetical protein